MSRNLKAGLYLFVLAALLTGAVWLLNAHYRSGAPVAAKPAPEAPHSTVAPETAASAWPLWGGAENSTAQSGPDFFSIEKRRAFRTSVAEALQKYVIELHARALLPLPDAAKNVLTALPAGEKHDLYMQFVEHPTPQQRNLLENSGVAMIGYVDGYAWQVRGTPDALSKSLSLDFVRALSAIDAHDKLLPQIFAGQTPAYAQTADGLTRFSLITDPGVSATSLQAAAAQAPALAAVTFQTRTSSVLGPRFEALAPRDAALALAALDQTRLVEFAPPPAENRDATTDLESNIADVRDNPPNDTGAGVLVAVRELGQPTAHVDFASRLQYITIGDSVSGDVDHATAVCGVIGSNGQSQPSAKGVAPNTQMLAYAVPTSSGTFSSADIVNAGTRGARLSNHSYGPTGLTTFGDYESVSADFDNAIHANNLLGMFAGNEEPGQTTKHIDFFVGAKNTICVGATDPNARAGDDNPPIAQANGISSFSQFGPMLDGRLKPDLVAFGTFVTLDQGTNATQVQSGTSFATPTVTGVASLAYQQYVATFGTPPNASLLKALLCNSATDLGNTGPDVMYGFGLVNAKAAINTILLKSASGSPFFEGSLSSGAQPATFTIAVGPSTPVLKATLCWMDVAGDPTAAKALVNDLDLKLTDPNGVAHFPYSIDPNNPLNPATNSGPNTVDPIEQIIIANPILGNWTVSVSPSNVPMGPQSFAVCINIPPVAIPLTSVFQASPPSGASPLSVSFTGDMSTGNGLTYAWNFGDGTTDTGADVIHTFTYSSIQTSTNFINPADDSDNFTVTLTVTASNGQQASSSQVINVSKPAPTTFPTRFTASVKTPTRQSDRMSFVLTTRSLVMTPQQAREALRDGTFEGQTYKIIINGVTIPTTTNPPPIILDQRATFRSPQVNVRHNFVQGQIIVTLSKQDLSTIFATAATGLFPIDIKVISPTAIYHATFNSTYKSNGKTASAKL